jgi:hypothetical protein
MSILYRGHSIDASYQISVHLAKRSQRRRILKICQSVTTTVCGGQAINIFDWLIFKTFLP